MKIFTIDEAQSMLPVLESLLQRALEAKREAEQVDTTLTELARQIYLAGGMRVDTAKVVHLRAEMESHLERVRENLTEIEAIGAQLKDLDAGLLDFPCRLEDQVVLLCWRKGEAAIEHWHTTESGFKDRQPVDERFRRRSAAGGRPN